MARCLFHCAQHLLRQTEGDFRPGVSAILEVSVNTTFMFQHNASRLMVLIQVLNQRYAGARRSDRDPRAMTMGQLDDPLSKRLRLLVQSIGIACYLWMFRTTEAAPVAGGSERSVSSDRRFASRVLPGAVPNRRLTDLPVIDNTQLVS